MIEAIAGSTFSAFWGSDLFNSGFYFCNLTSGLCNSPPLLESGIQLWIPVKF